ncbi:MAG TPA: glycosyltransferase family 2 protein [Anaerolineales bacterium]|nr:glycosyltransferase family 2 protein [Anaerolineales bacterium]
MFPYVIVLILNWNNPQDTIVCLESVTKSDYPNFSVVVIDNGSTDNSVTMLRQSFPNLDIQELHSNFGYAEGNNIGMRYALSKRADYLLILNNDTWVAQDMLNELVKYAVAHPAAGMVGPKVLCGMGKDILFASGSFINWHKGEIMHRGMFQVEDQPSLSNPEDVDFIIGCGVLVSKALVTSVGMLDARYYLNFEDVEWSIRAKREGFAVVYVPKAKMWHKVSASLGLASPMNTYYMTRNALLFFGSQSSGVWKIISILSILVRTLRTVAAWTFKQEYKTKDYNGRRIANLYALRDYFLGRFGQMGSDVRKACLDL